MKLIVEPSSTCEASFNDLIILSPSNSIMLDRLRWYCKIAELDDDEVGTQHTELDKVVRLLPFIQHKGDKVTMSQPLDPAKLLPTTFGYWTYPGSLTTPPCTESVTWILFKEPVQVSAAQLALMRKLKCGEASRGVEAMELLHNYRPTLPLGNRELRDFGGN